MSNRAAMIELLLSDRAEVISDEDRAAFGNAPPTSARGRQPLAAAPETAINQDLMYRLVTDYIAGKHPKLPTDPRLRAFFQRVFKQIDEMPPDAAPYLPPES
jgi:hypothetical protein